MVNILYAIGIVADWIRSGRLEVKKGNKTTFLADCDTGEVRIVANSFSLSSGETIDSIAQDKADSALDSAKEYADSAAENAVDNQTQTDIFNKLTNNGKAKGIYMEGGELYINASYMKTGYISADRIQGGTLILGGANNVNGKMSIRNSSNVEIGRWDKDGIYVNAGSIYCKTATTGVSIYGGRMHMTHGDTDVGYIGTNYMEGHSSYKGLVFDLEYTGAYMTWSAKASASDTGYPAKLLYASKTFSSFTAGKLYAFCNMDFRNYDIQNSYINGLRVKTSFNIPNNVDCNIYSNVDFHNFQAQNIRINNLDAINGYPPFTGRIKVPTTEGGWGTFNVVDGIIISASDNIIYS